jgi:hypothetical protein
MVATTLPADVDPQGNPAAWIQTGFVTATVAGGNPDSLLPVNRPVVQVDCWAAVPGSLKPPWWQADAIASAIRRACWSRLHIARPLSIAANGVTYPSAVVQGARLVTSFRRIYGDGGNYARYQGDLWLSWITVNDRID